MGEAEAIVDKRRLQVVVRVDDLVARSAVADFQIQHVVRRFVDQPVGIAAAGFEAGAHAGRQWRGAVVGVKGRTALQDVDELVLFGMGMAQRGNRAGLQFGQIDAEILQAKQIPQRPLFPACQPDAMQVQNGLRI